jgi:hypothetical protein
MGAQHNSRTSEIMTKTIKSVVFASAVASMFAGAAFAADKAPKKMATPAAADTEIRCASVNECKGQGACGGADHGCAGQNECKGKGWIKLTEKACKAKGGTVVADAK